MRRRFRGRASVGGDSISERSLSFDSIVSGFKVNHLGSYRVGHHTCQRSPAHIV